MMKKLSMNEKSQITRRGKKNGKSHLGKKDDKISLLATCDPHRVKIGGKSYMRRKAKVTF